MTLPAPAAWASGLSPAAPAWIAEHGWPTTCGEEYFGRHNGLLTPLVDYDLPK